MPWLRIDDRFTEHRKILQLAPGQRWAWLELLCYCARHNSGHLPANIIQVLRAATPTLLQKAVRAGLLDPNTDGSYEVHDWNIYNPKDPTSAARQARWRAKNRPPVDDTVTEPVDTEVTAHVTENVDAESDAPRAGTRARPLPSPTPTTTSPSSVVVARDDDEQLNQALNGIPLTGPARTAALELQATDPERLQACVTASTSAAKPAAYLAELIRNGSHPEPDRPDVAAGAVGTRSVRKPDPGPCPDCGQTFGHGHLESCPRLPAVAPEHGPGEPRVIEPPPPELLATVGLAAGPDPDSDPEPDLDPEPRVGGPPGQATTEEAA